MTMMAFPTLTNYFRCVSKIFFSELPKTLHVQHFHSFLKLSQLLLHDSLVWKKDALVNGANHLQCSKLIFNCVSIRFVRSGMTANRSKTKQNVAEFGSANWAIKLFAVNCCLTSCLDVSARNQATCFRRTRTITWKTNSAGPRCGKRHFLGRHLCFCFLADRSGLSYFLGRAHLPAKKNFGRRVFLHVNSIYGDVQLNAKRTVAPLWIQKNKEEEEEEVTWTSSGWEQVDVVWGEINHQLR